MKSNKRQKQMAEKRASKASRMNKKGNKSNYAKKAEFLKRHGGNGFDYPLKPWKSTN